MCFCAAHSGSWGLWVSTRASCILTVVLIMLSSVDAVWVPLMISCYSPVLSFVICCWSPFLCVPQVSTAISVFPRTTSTRFIHPVMFTEDPWASKPQFHTSLPSGQSLLPILQELITSVPKDMFVLFLLPWGCGSSFFLPFHVQNIL